MTAEYGSVAGGDQAHSKKGELNDTFNLRVPAISISYSAKGVGNNQLQYALGFDTDNRVLSAPSRRPGVNAVSGDTESDLPEPDTGQIHAINILLAPKTWA